MSSTYLIIYATVNTPFARLFTREYFSFATSNRREPQKALFDKRGSIVKTMTRLLKNLESPNILICLTLYSGISYPSGEKGGRHASILRKVPYQEGNEGCQGYNHEEWQTRDAGSVPGMQD